MPYPQGFERVGLHGKSIIVTGGGSGIGRAASLLAASRGASVTIVDMNERAGDEAVREIVAAGGKAQFVATDISSESDTRRMVEHAARKFGGLDGAFNNAGIQGSIARITDYALEDWNRVLEVNLTGLFLCMKAELAFMADHAGGSIVNTASTAAVVAYPRVPAYAASKHAVLGLSRQAALDFANDRVRVNALLPGTIETPMSAGSLADPEVRAHVEQAQPVGRLGKAQEIAEIAAWLLSDASSFATGAAFTVDGGATAV